MDGNYRKITVMARVRYIEKSEAAPEALEVYEDLEKLGVAILNPFKALAHSPKLLLRWWRMMQTAVNELELDAHLRELVLLRIFQLTGCDYCFQEHVRIGKRVGLSDEQIQNVGQYLTHPIYTDLQRRAMKYAEMITLENKVDDAEFNRLKQDLGDRGMVELTFCIGNWNGLSRFIVPLGLELQTLEKS